MSAIRRGRSSHRSANSLPYSRPNSVKKSSWTLGSLLNFLNPIRAFSPEQVEENEPSYPVEQTRSPAQSMSQRGHEMAKEQKHVTEPAGPLPATDSPSKSENLKRLVSFLHESRDGLSGPQLDGLATAIEQNIPVPVEEKRVPFRFSSTPATSPRRGNSPLPSPAGTTFRFSTPTPSGSSPSPKKMLTRNPNGVYRWQGAGSARPLKARNRYHSPAFGSPRSTPEKIVLRDSPEKKDFVTPHSEKRRRLDETSTINGVSTPSPSPPQRSAAPAPSPTRAAQAASQGSPLPISEGTPSPSPKVNGVGKRPPAVATPTGLRSNGPTTPVHPSPLRQTWGQESPPETSRQTKAANYMSELIKEVTPPKKPDISNPYQAASPVKNISKRRTRATNRAAPPKKAEEPVPNPEGEKEEKEYSAQAIIEATLPKGSKRSRPPTQPEKPVVRSPSPPALRRSPRRDTVSPTKSHKVEIEEVDDEDDKRTSKRTKPNGIVPETKKPSESPIEIVDLDEPEAPAVPPSKAPAPVTAPTGRPFNVSSLKASTAPKEPSKLRYVFQPESSSPPSFTSPVAAPSLPTFTPPTLSPATQVDLPSTSKVLSPQEAALAVPSNKLPTFTFTLSAGALLPTDAHNKEAAKALPVSSLPTFDLTKKPAPVEEKPQTVGFNWGATNLKPPVNDDKWKCSLCMCTNSLDLTQCEVCGTDR